MSGMAGIHDGFDDERERGGRGGEDAGGQRMALRWQGKQPFIAQASKRLQGRAFLVARYRRVDGVRVV